MKRRIGILTSGGDCPGLNATIRGVAKACYERFGVDNVDIVGISNGYYGLINNLCKEMSPGSFSGILTDTQYGQDVLITAGIPAENYAPFGKRLSDLSAGRLEASFLEESFMPVSVK